MSKSSKAIKTEIDERRIEYVWHANIKQKILLLRVVWALHFDSIEKLKLKTLAKWWGASITCMRHSCIGVSRVHDLWPTSRQILEKSRSVCVALAKSRNVSKTSCILKRAPTSPTKHNTHIRLMFHYRLFSRLSIIEFVARLRRLSCSVVFNNTDYRFQWNPQYAMLSLVQCCMYDMRCTHWT